MGDVWAIVVAAGSGRRFGGAKQYEPLVGRRVIDWSLAATRAVVDGVVLVVAPVHAGDEEGAATFNGATKYVASTTMSEHPWQDTVFLNGDVVGQIKALKEQEGPDLQVHGSATFVQTLLQHDLVDELWLKIFPVTLGQGKRLFAGGTIPRSYALIESKSSPSGVIIARFERAGELQTGVDDEEVVGPLEADAGVVQGADHGEPGEQGQPGEAVLRNVRPHQDRGGKGAAARGGPAAP